MKNDYLLLLARRESKEMLGRKCSNLLILTAVLTVTFVAVAFSWAGKRYLQFKMSDPFTNWVNVENNYGKGNYEQFFIDLISNESIRQQYQINSVSGDDYEADWFMGADGNEHFLECRFFGDFEGNLIKAVLDDNNVIEGCAAPVESIGNETYGLIITADALKKLGYDLNDVPAFINVSNPAGDDLSLGLELYEFMGKYYSMNPMPLLGVVKSLPMNMDIIGSHFWYVQSTDNITYPYFINDEKYFARDQLYYYVENGNDSAFVKAVNELSNQSSRRLSVIKCEVPLESLKPWKEGVFYQVMYGGASTPAQERAEFDRKIQDAVKDNGVTRVFKYDYAQEYENNNYLFYSVNFSDLKSIIEFEKYVKENYKIQLEISQVTSKQNFRIVSMIANVLTIVMIVFAIFCIVMYIINMLQNYFQKVKRNLGTFKAFGMESSSLIRVYVITLLVIVLVAILAAFVITGIASLALRLFGAAWDDGYPLIVAFNIYSMASVIVIIVSVVSTVFIVLRRLLSQTPGDLIYDR